MGRLAGLQLHREAEGLLHREAEGLSVFPIDNAYHVEEKSFMNIVEAVPTSTLHHVIDTLLGYQEPLEGAPHPNIIGSYTIYRIKVLADGSLKCKCRIQCGQVAPHGNELHFEDDDKAHLSSDSASCTPLAFQVHQG